MELYCAIGKTACQRDEKCAAVMAAEYLHENYPNVSGFSPRNIRRMWDFYHTYESYPQLLKLAVQIGWIQNVVIMEADLTVELREWYLRAAMQFGWSKMELIANIADEVHGKIALNGEDKTYYNEKKMENTESQIAVSIWGVIRRILQRIQYRSRCAKGHQRRWISTYGSWLIFLCNYPDFSVPKGCAIIENVVES